MGFMFKKNKVKKSTQELKKEVEIINKKNREQIKRTKLENIIKQNKKKNSVLYKARSKIGNVKKKANNIGNYLQRFEGLK